MTDHAMAQEDMWRILKLINGLKSEATCPICLSILSSPLVVQACQHVFCKECIEHALSIKNECPTCRRATYKRRLTAIDGTSDLFSRLHFFFSLPVLGVVEGLMKQHTWNLTRQGEAIEEGRTCSSRMDDKDGDDRRRYYCWNITCISQSRQGDHDIFDGEVTTALIKDKQIPVTSPYRRVTNDAQNSSKNSRRVEATANDNSLLHDDVRGSHWSVRYREMAARRGLSTLNDVSCMIPHGKLLGEALQSKKMLMDVNGEEQSKTVANDCKYTNRGRDSEIENLGKKLISKVTEGDSSDTCFHYFVEPPHFFDIPTPDYEIFLGRHQINDDNSLSQGPDSSVQVRSQDCNNQRNDATSSVMTVNDATGMERRRSSLTRCRQEKRKPIGILNSQQWKLAIDGGEVAENDGTNRLDQTDRDGKLQRPQLEGPLSYSDGDFPLESLSKKIERRDCSSIAHFRASSCPSLPTKLSSFTPVLPPHDHRKIGSHDRHWNARERDETKIMDQDGTPHGETSPRLLSRMSSPPCRGSMAPGRLRTMSSRGPSSKRPVDVAKSSAHIQRGSRAVEGVVAASRLTPSEKDLLRRFSSRFRFHFDDGEKADVKCTFSHLIVPSSDAAFRTKKYILALAGGRLVLKFDFIRESLFNRTLVDPKDHIVKRDTKGVIGGCDRARKSPGHLFHNLRFHLLLPEKKMLTNRSGGRKYCNREKNPYFRRGKRQDHCHSSNKQNEECIGDIKSETPVELLPRSFLIEVITLAGGHLVGEGLGLSVAPYPYFEDEQSRKMDDGIKESSARKVDEDNVVDRHKACKLDEVLGKLKKKRKIAKFNCRDVQSPLCHIKETEYLERPQRPKMEVSLDEGDEFEASNNRTREYDLGLSRQTIEGYQCNGSATGIVENLIHGDNASFFVSKELAESTDKRKFSNGVETEHRRNLSKIKYLSNHSHASRKYGHKCSGKATAAWDCQSWHIKSTFDACNSDDEVIVVGQANTFHGLDSLSFPIEKSLSSSASCLDFSGSRSHSTSCLSDPHHLFSSPPKPVPDCSGCPGPRNHLKMNGALDLFLVGTVAERSRIDKGFCSWYEKAGHDSTVSSTAQAPCHPKVDAWSVGDGSTAAVRLNNIDTCESNALGSERTVVMVPSDDDADSCIRTPAKVILAGHVGRDSSCRAYRGWHEECCGGICHYKLSTEAIDDTKKDPSAGECSATQANKALVRVGCNGVAENHGICDQRGYPNPRCAISVYRDGKAKTNKCIMIDGVDCKRLREDSRRVEHHLLESNATSDSKSDVEDGLLRMVGGLDWSEDCSKVIEIEEHLSHCKDKRKRKGRSERNMMSGQKEPPERKERTVVENPISVNHSTPLVCTTTENTIQAFASQSSPPTSSRLVGRCCPVIVVSDGTIQDPNRPTVTPEWLLNCICAYKLLELPGNWRWR